MPPNQVSLCVEDPIDPTNDTARGSFNMKLVRQVGGCIQKQGVLEVSGTFARHSFQKSDRVKKSQRVVIALFARQFAELMSPDQSPV